MSPRQEDSPEDYYGVENVIAELEAQRRDGDILSPQEMAVVSTYRKDQRRWMEKRLRQTTARRIIHGETNLGSQN